MPDATRNIDETLLVLRCQLGEEAAFAEIVARYGQRVSYYLRKMLGDADRADDAMQELWIDVFRSITKLRDPGSFAPWLYRLARDRAYRTMRSAKPQAAFANLDVDGVDVADEPDDAFSPEDAREVHAALDRLNPEHREVLLLRFVESMTYPEIAEVTGCELGTVRSRLHYAKRGLRRLLERNHDEPGRIQIETH